MNFQQLRYARETFRQGLNLTEAARRLHTSQPGVSKQIRELESELGIEIFVRRGRRITALTEPGKAAIEVIERLLREAENLRQVGREFLDQHAGTLTIATTHTQARYALPKVVGAFKRRYPKVHLTIKQGSPPQLAEMLASGEADIAIATESLDQAPKLIALPAYQWQHCAVVPQKHPLAKASRVTLELLAQHPLITYDPAFAGRSHIDSAFRAHGLDPDFVLSAVDSDVIKTYVEIGLGVGIIATPAFDEKKDRPLRAIGVGHLFGTMTTRVALRRGAALRGYAYVFIELFSPQLTRGLIGAALSGKGEDYGL